MKVKNNNHAIIFKHNLIALILIIIMLNSYIDNWSTKKNNKMLIFDKFN